MGHHCLKAALRKPFHELAGGDAEGAAFVADVLQHSTNTTRNHKCPERNKCSSTAQSQALLHLGNHCRSPILTLAVSTTKKLYEWRAVRSCCRVYNHQKSKEWHILWLSNLPGFPVGTVHPWQGRIGCVQALSKQQQVLLLFAIKVLSETSLAYRDITHVVSLPDY